MIKDKTKIKIGKWAMERSRYLAKNVWNDEQMRLAVDFDLIDGLIDYEGFYKDIDFINIYNDVYLSDKCSDLLFPLPLTYKDVFDFVKEIGGNVLDFLDIESSSSRLLLTTLYHLNEECDLAETEEMFYLFKEYFPDAFEELCVIMGYDLEGEK